MELPLDLVDPTEAVLKQVHNSTSTVLCLLLIIVSMALIVAHSHYNL